MEKRRLNNLVYLEYQSSIHAPDGNSARRGKKERHRGISLSRNWSVLFSGLLIYFLLYIGMNTESRGVSRPDPCQNQVLHIKLYKDLRGFTSSYGHEACWHFMALSDNGQSTRKLFFSRGDFFLNQVPPSKYSCIPIGWGCSGLQSRKEFTYPKV